MGSRRWLFSPLIALAATAAVAFGQDKIPWQPNLETAQQVASQTNRLVLIHFWSTTCAPCKRVEKDVFTKTEVSRALDANFVMVKLNVDEAPTTARLYGVSSIPTDVITTPSGRLVSQIISPRTPSQYVAQMNQAANGYQSLVRRQPPLVANNNAAQYPPMAQPPAMAGQVAVPQQVAVPPQVNGPPQVNIPPQVAPQMQVANAPPAAMQPNAQFAPPAVAANNYPPFNPQAQGAGVPNTGAFNAATAPSMPAANQAAPYAPGATPSYGAPRYADYAPPSANYVPIQPQANAPASVAPPTGPAAPGGANVADAFNTPASVPPGNPTVAEAAPHFPPDNGAAPGSAANNFASSAPPDGNSAAPSATAAGAAGAADVAMPGAAPGVGATAPDTSLAAGASAVSQSQNPATGAPGIGVPNAPAPPGLVPTRPPVPQLPPGCPPLGLDGNCPVTLVERRQSAIGDKAYGAVHRGRTYLFLGPAEKEKFLMNPDLYSPVMSGNDPVLALDNQTMVAGRYECGVFYGSRIYLFESEATLQKFKQQPDRYAAEVVQASREQNMQR